ncbi:MAG: mannosyl-3-phosphoglycerate phosphatase [Candidatus Altiarchaeales archaeon ex4484_96]|nr:MAG: mannosyl-3-phosphoglycerate phosphatase [Candidatus Altiarchaeales archaeon ex4484_96]
MPDELIIYSDLDGTLLDEKYSFRDALPALRRLKEKDIPLILCSSKTRAEIEIFREKMGLMTPFISENGGSVFIPSGYFDDVVYDKKVDGYGIFELGTPIKQLRNVLAQIKKNSGCMICGFGDMSLDELIKVSGLDESSALLAQKREYDEPFIMDCAGEDKTKVFDLIQQKGLYYTVGGLFYHLMGDNNKGKAAGILTQLYRGEGFSGHTVGLGDSLNDIPLLESVDLPVLVKKPDNSFANYKSANLVRTEKIGPAGWNQIVCDLLDDLY